MITLKEILVREPKEKVYLFYQKLVERPLRYEKITRNEIYHEIVSLYKKNPEIILNLCTMEEIQVLKSMVREEDIILNHGYIEYTIYCKLKDNFLLVEEKKNQYIIPEDIFNYVKMAVNIFDEKSESLKDITDSVFLGLVRIYNVIKIEDFLHLLPSYYIQITLPDLKSYVRKNPKLIPYIKIIKYQKEEYFVSLENYYYKDVLALQKEDIKYREYLLEEVISIGKYKLNLFREEMFQYLSFLENHLHPRYIDMIINELVIYRGFDMKEEEVLENITDHIKDLYDETKKVLDFFPIWIYRGNDLKSLKRNTILPNKNDLCPCGSGKKYKNCCGKFYNN